MNSLKCNGQNTFKVDLMYRNHKGNDFDGSFAGSTCSMDYQGHYIQKTFVQAHLKLNHFPPDIKTKEKGSP